MRDIKCSNHIKNIVQPLYGEKQYQEKTEEPYEKS